MILQLLNFKMAGLLRIASFSLACFLAGCASFSPPKGADVGSGIKVQSGYQGCTTECNKVKTYSSPLLQSDEGTHTSGPFTGHVHVRVSLAATNNTEGRIPAYRLVVAYATSGNFNSSAEGLHARLNGVDLKTVGSLEQSNCSLAVSGQSCFWVQHYALPASYLRSALSAGSGLRFTFGYFSSPPKDLIGVYSVIASDQIKGFVEGLGAMGAAIPQD